MADGSYGAANPSPLSLRARRRNRAIGPRNQKTTMTTTELHRSSPHIHFAFSTHDFLCNLVRRYMALHVLETAAASSLLSTCGSAHIRNRGRLFPASFLA